MPAGRLALILHAHLPFVRHPEHEEFLEEDWLFEAITETYLPLLDVFHRLAEEGIPYRVAVSLTPPLGHMLSDPLLRSRYDRYLNRLVALAENELERTRGNNDEQGLARFYLLRLLRLKHWWEERWKRDLVSAFAALRKHGSLELVACAATHAYLPLIERRESVGAQIHFGVEAYREMFGAAPRGMWLPECAYRSGLDRVLAENEIRWFVLDAHALALGKSQARFAAYAPIFTPEGVAAFGRDRESAQQVWSAIGGYPGDPAYRDFYRDAGWDMPEEAFRRFYPSGLRRFTGLKFHRVTGSEPKDLYARDEAMKRVEEHARHFLEAQIRQLERIRPAMPIPPITVCPFDAELFGHWWFEGPEWIEAVLRGAARMPSAIRLTSPDRYLEEFDAHQIVEPAVTSWGDGGFNAVWLDESNAWIYPQLHTAERRMAYCAQIYANGRGPSPLDERCLRQLARELLLAQASDWAFLMRSGTAREYATRRTREHLERFNLLHEQLLGERIDTAFLESCEERDNIFPRLNWRIYA